jgi:hypothetical protein
LQYEQWQKWVLVKNSPADLQRIESVQEGSLLVATENGVVSLEKQFVDEYISCKGLRYNAMSREPI